MTTFETAQVGDKVWDLLHNRWFTIKKIEKNSDFPIRTELISYTIDGKMNRNGGRTLFWDEVIITPPEKPMPKLGVDTKVLVWDDPNEEPTRGYFSHFDENGQIATFSRGRTSWSKLATTVTTVLWQHWELAEDNK